ncbi:MAG: CRISPR system precrRNA processing endoribonuclease RAMP protein Cas6 [Trichloromonas sp.]|jgi:hypothetical protein|nr:CRISPR system precrRNA processing endoribonuclease RAMP protein Cas6 [Trichloromonas sp.]
MTTIRIETPGTRAAANIRLYRYRIFLKAEAQLNLPEFKGAALRGLFGHALRQVACTIPGEDCRVCPFAGECAYAVLFESMPPVGFPDAGKYRDFPRPYLINPPLSRRQTYSPGQCLVFDLVLVGLAAEYLPHVIYAFDSLGRSGFGGRGRCSVARVENIDEHGAAAVVFRDGNLLGPGQALLLSGEEPVAGHEISLNLHFITPARLESKGKLQDQAPEFGFLIRTFAQRVALLASLYCAAGDPRDLIQPDFFDQAETVHLLDSDVEWREHERFSTRQQARLKQGGIVGTAVYQGPIQPFIPYLRLMLYLNIGKSTTFGLGRVSVTLG